MPIIMGMKVPSETSVHKFQIYDRLLQRPCTAGSAPRKPFTSKHLGRLAVASTHRDIQPRSSEAHDMSHVTYMSHVACHIFSAKSTANQAHPQLHGPKGPAAGILNLTKNLTTIVGDVTDHASFLSLQRPQVVEVAR